MVAYFITFALLLCLCLLIPKKSKEASDQKAPFLRGARRFGLILLCAALLFEVFVANFRSFHLLFGDYETVAVDLQGENVKVSGTEKDGSLTSQNGGQTVVLEMVDIGRPVGTLHIELDMPKANYEGEAPDHGTPYVNVGVDAKDVTQMATYRYGVANGQIIRGDRRSAYVNLDLSGDVEALRIALTAQNGQVFTVKSITFNKTVPMQFSAIRLLLIVGIAFAIYALFKCPSMLSTYGDRQKALRIGVFVMTVVMVLMAVSLNFLRNYGEGGNIILGDGGNQMTKDLVEAFEAGQVHLLEEPPKELLDMENPYDWSERVAANLYYKWDHLLFEGKYYSYYGIAPVVTLFLPFHMVTGQYFDTSFAVLLFTVLGIMFLSLLFLEFCKRYGKSLPVNVLLCTLFIMQMSSGAWYNLVYDNFYEIAQSSGFMCVCAGFYFLLKSNLIGEGIIKYRHIVFATLFLAMGVLCRPTLAVYCVAALAFLVWGFFKQRDALADKDKATRNKEVVKYALASLSCFVLIGGVQMWYNYARFGNILDFGIQYSLTINDFTRAQYHTDFAMIGFWNFLFAFPIIRPEFPYVFSNFSTLDANGYYFIANTNAVGLFIRALPTLGFAGGFLAWRQLKKKEKWQAATLLLPVCVICPLVIIFSIWESGYGVRYCCDFAWQLILGGAAVLFFLYAKKAQPQTKKIMQGFFVVSAVLALFINGAMVYDYLDKGGYLTAEFLSFERMFDFWI